MPPPKDSLVGPLGIIPPSAGQSEGALTENLVKQKQCLESFKWKMLEGRICLCYTSKHLQRGTVPITQQAPICQQRSLQFNLRSRSQVSIQAEPSCRFAHPQPCPCWAWLALWIELGPSYFPLKLPSDPWAASDSCHCHQAGPAQALWDSTVVSEGTVLPVLWSPSVHPPSGDSPRSAPWQYHAHHALLLFAGHPPGLDGQVLISWDSQGGWH